MTHPEGSSSSPQLYLHPDLAHQQAPTRPMPGRDRAGEAKIDYQAAQPPSTVRNLAIDLPGDPTTTRTRIEHMRGAGESEDFARQLNAWRQSVTSEHPEPRFDLVGQLGQGSQGVVFNVFDRDCRRGVALKTLNQTSCDTAEVSRFIHEAQITAQLEHPGIVPVHDFAVLGDGTVFYTMKRVEGESLAAYLLDRAGKSTERYDMLQIFLKICETVGFAHSRGVIHRDLKPRNIMVGSFGEVLVMDWGLAKVLDAKGVAAPTVRVTSLRSDSDIGSVDIHKTHDGFAVGTPAYMSPEQARGQSDKVSPRSDIYCLGVLLFEIIGGRSPYRRGDVRQTLEQVALGEITRLDQIEPTLAIEPALVSIVHKAMSYRQEDRYATAEELAGDVRGYLMGHAVTAHRETILETLDRHYRRNQKLVHIVAISALVMVMAFSGLAIWQRHDRRVAIEALRAQAHQDEAVGDHEAARSCYDKLLGLDGTDSDARQEKGRLLERMKQEREDEDRRVKEKADHDHLVEDRNMAQGYFAEGERLRDNNNLADMQAALEKFNQADALNKDDPKMRGAALMAAQKLQEFQDQQVAERQKRKEDGDAEDLCKQAVELEHQGGVDNLAEAVAKMEASINLRPSKAAQDYRDHLRQAERFFRAKPDLDAMRKAIAAGDGVVARDSLMRARGTAPDHPDLKDADAAITATFRQQDEHEALGLVAKARSAMSSAHETHDKRARATFLGDAVKFLTEANAKAVEYAPVEQAAADYFVERLLEAEAEGNLDAAAVAENQAKTFDKKADRHHDVLIGLVRLDLDPRSPPLALQEIVPAQNHADERMGPVHDLVPGKELLITRGRYLVTNAAGAITARRFERGHQYAPLLVPAPPKLPPDTAFVPGGTIYVPKGTINGPGRTPVGEVAAFAITRHEITCGEYLEFLNDENTLRKYERSRLDGNFTLAPRLHWDSSAPIWRQKGFGLKPFLLETAEQSVAIDPCRPVSGISFEDAVEYARWRARRDKLPWRLPKAEEWQLAAQGGDGRTYPWGDGVDLELCWSDQTNRSMNLSGEAAVERFRHDRSVQGVFDLAGSLSEFVEAKVRNPDNRVEMGGNFRESDPEHFSAWYRQENDYRWPSPIFGFRLVLDLPDHPGADSP